MKYQIRPDDYLRVLVASLLGTVAGAAVAGLDDLMMGRPLSLAWLGGVWFVAMGLFYALSLVIWRREH